MAESTRLSAIAAISMRRPEISYAAVAAFMSGNAQSRKAIDVLEGVFPPGSVILAEHVRGALL
ncbi:MAG TPA: hypothetical protein VFF38_13080 [Microvirga sp.]|nr:hypothetical protein [Microvirga sp.]